MVNLNLKGEVFFLLFVLSVVIVINSKQPNEVLRCIQ